MRSLLKNYINLLSIQKLNDFAIQNSIYLNTNELNSLLGFIKENWEKIIQDEKPFIKELEKILQKENTEKVLELYLIYKDKYKEYLF